MQFGILTVSDRCYNKETEDISSVRLTEAISKEFVGSKIISEIVPDETNEITSQLISWCNSGCDVIFTSGGTGFAPRDVTPEATKRVIEKEASGLAYAMISKSLAITEMAMLSRPVCGIRQKTLIINLPGSPKGAVECFGFIKNTLMHAVALIKDEKAAVSKVHKEVVQKIHQPSTNAMQSDVKISSLSKVKVDNVASRPRESSYPMLEVEQACDLITAEISPILEIELVPYEESLNRILAEDIYAHEPIPPFPASIKDGYAVKISDQEKIRIVRQVVAAGDKPSQEELKSGEAIRISTGAPIPPGANAVIQVEDTSIVEKSPDGKLEISIEIKKNPTAGQDIRAVGSDVPAGSVVLNKFDRLTPAHLGILASVGKTEVKVIKQPAIAVISTGNEVKDPREKIDPGQIRDSNKIILLNFLRQYHYSPVDCGIIKDDPNAVKNALEKVLSQQDVVITTGGVSMGEFDILKQVLIEDFAAVVHFGRVNMKPGKPTTFATFKYKGNVKYFFGLPGNPVSCSVTLILFVIPALRYMERDRQYKFPVISAHGKMLLNRDSRPEYHRVRISNRSGSNDYEFISTGNQISSRLNSMVNANGLALVPSTGKLSTVSKDIQKYFVILFDQIRS